MGPRANSMSERTGHHWLQLVILAVLVGCGSPPAEVTNGAADSWSVTAWGQRFEVFPEIDPLVVGQVAMAHTHVTRLADFAPWVEARVEIVLAGPHGEEVFGADQPDRPGIYSIAVTPSQSGEADLSFRIHAPEGLEEISGGTVQVATAAGSDTLLRAPAPRGGTDGGQPISFLKEQQWKSLFATSWVQKGRLAQSVVGLATFRPPAGGESTVTAPMDGVIQPAGGSHSWPFVGLRVAKGASLFRVVPLVAPERSLAALEAELATLTTELNTAKARRARLEELLELEATSQREVEEARERTETLELRRRAAKEDLAAARSARGGTTGDRPGIALDAPFSGEIAAVTATLGATVESGDSLARLVRTDSVWIEVALPPKDARRIATTGIRGLVLEDPEIGAMRIDDGISLISVAPEVSPSTGTVTVLIEVPNSTGFALGSTVTAQLLSSEDRAGIVVPASALVDDGGIPIVYLQLSGENFVRQEVSVLARQGDRVLLDQLIPGQRLVTRGGDAIRRSSLMSSGEAQGHVH